MKTILLLFCLIPLWTLSQTPSINNIISSYAGGGDGRNFGDGIPATKALLWKASAVVLDASGNIYIADEYNGRIRKVSTSGIITTIAGTGTQGYNGDSIPATQAQLNNPTGLAIDKFGNIYIADLANYRIRKITTSGMIITVAGNGNSNEGADNILAVNSGLSFPNSVAVDTAGNIFLIENNKVKKVSTAGIITTYAGTGGYGYNGDGILAITATLSLGGGSIVSVDKKGNVYIGDAGNSRIRRIDKTGIITTVAGNGMQGYNGDNIAATSAKLYAPVSAKFDNAGNMFIAEYSGSRLRKVNTSGIITTYAGTGVYGMEKDSIIATSSMISPADVALDSAGNAYITDFSRICKINTADTIYTVAGNGFGGYGYLPYNSNSPATTQTFNTANAVAADTKGNVYVCDQRNQSIFKINPYGVMSTFASYYFSPTVLVALNYPTGVAADNKGNVYISDYYQRIEKIDSSGHATLFAGTGTNGYNGDSIPATQAELNNPSGVAVDSLGDVYICDQSNNRIRMVDPSGMITTVAGTGATGPYNGDGLAKQAVLWNPVAVTADAKGDVYISCGHVFKISAGIITTLAGAGTNYGDSIPALSAGVGSPNGIAIDNSGNLYFTDVTLNKVRKIDVKDIITTVAGTGNPGYNGDGILSNTAQLYGPQGLAVDTSGNLFIADKGYSRIRRIGHPLVSWGYPNECFALQNDTINISNNHQWVYITDNNGWVVAAINANGNNLGVIRSSVFIDSTSGRNYNGHPYANRSITLSSDNQPSSSISVKLYLRQTELNKLEFADASVHSINDVKLFRNHDGCSPYAVNNAYPLTTFSASYLDDYELTGNSDSLGTFYFASSIYGSLPVTWLNFNGALRNNETYLNWSTANEFNSKGFEVQKSMDGQTFAGIGFVEGAGNSSIINNYSYTDTKVLSGSNFYRLKQIDKDGRFSYSSVIKIEYSSFKWAVLGNPVTNNSWVQLQLDKTANVSLQIISINGAIIKTINKGIIAAGTYSIQLNLPNTNTNMYVVRLVVNGETFSKKIIK